MALADISEATVLTAAQPRREAIALVAGDPVPFAEDEESEEVEAVRGPFDGMILTLVLYGDDLDPDDVSRRMGCQPTSARRRGERLAAGAAADASSPYPTGTWRLEVQGDAFTRASDLIERLLGRFPVEPAFWQPLNRDFALQLHLSVHDAARDCGFILATEALTRCAATGASLLVTYHVDDRRRGPAGAPA